MIKEILKELNRDIRRKFGISLSFVHERPSLEFVKNKFGNKPLIGAEIGTFQGENAKYILEDLNIKKLYLIDPWEDYQGYKDYEKGGQKKNLNKALKKTLKRIKNYKEKVKLIKKFSSDAVKDIKEKLDFIYIDGNHDYKFVKEDMENYYKKLKKGGVLAGHDIPLPGVTKAFVEFVSKIKNSNPHIEHRDWWIVKE